MQQFSRLSLTLAKRYIQYGGQAVSLRFLAPEIPRVIFAQFYSSPKRRGMTDARFLVKIGGPWVCLTAALQGHSLRCWRAGIFIDKVVFTRSNAGGKVNPKYSRRVISEEIERQACWNVKHRHGRILESSFRV